jgi:hypothetical protein
MAAAIVIDLVENAGLPFKQEQRMLKDLEKALNSLQRGNWNAGCAQLRSFQNKVEDDLAGDNSELAHKLILSAQIIIDAVQAGNPGESSSNGGRVDQ